MATVFWMLMLSFVTSLITCICGQSNGGYFSLIENIDAGGTNLAASWKKYDGVNRRLRCLQLCLTEALCQSVYYDESTLSCYINAGSVNQTSSSSVTGLSYAGYLLRCYINLKCLKMSDYSVLINGKPLYSGCIDAKNKGAIENGTYYVDPDGTGAILVWCDFMENTAYAAFQKRVNGSVNFYRGWVDYKTGFGDPLGEYWLGLDNIYRLTNVRQPKLNVYLEDFTGAFRNAYYASMSITNESGMYNLTLGAYSGDAGDALGPLSGQQATGMKFTTYDQDNDLAGGNCAVRFKGAWWYKSCHMANLNGAYLGGAHSTFADGMDWQQWLGYYYSLKITIMRIAV